MLDRKSKKEHRAEVKEQEKEVGKAVEASAENLADRKVVDKVAKHHKGGTAEGASEAGRRLRAAGQSVRAEFDKHTKERQEAETKVKDSAEKDAQERDTSYDDARKAGEAAGELNDRGLKKEFSAMRGENARDAAFFNMQRQERETIRKNSERLGREMDDQMRRVDSSDSDFSGASAKQGKSDAGGKRVKVEWTHPGTGEKFIHKEKGDGAKHLYYGPPDTKEEKRHGHAVFDEKGQVKFNRKPKGE